MSARLLLLFAIAGFCSAALAVEPCSDPDHAINFKTGQPCPTQPPATTTKATTKAPTKANWDSSTPQMVTEEGNLKFKVKGGKRIG